MFSYDQATAIGEVVIEFGLPAVCGCLVLAYLIWLDVRSATQNPQRKANNTRANGKPELFLVPQEIH